MCKDNDVVKKTTKEKLSKRRKEELVDSVYELRKIVERRDKENKYLLNYADELKMLFYKEKNSKLNYMRGLAISLVIILILICILGL